MATTSSVLSGLYKQVYADNIYSLIPESNRIIKKVPFETKAKLGDKYHQPVVVSQEQGFTYASATSGAFTLLGNVPMATQDAQIQGTQIAAQYIISMEAVTRSVAGGAAAFEDATNLQYENVMASFGKRLEIEVLYGSETLALVTSFANTSATVTTCTITDASWAIGIWAGMENAKFNFYNSGSLVSSGADSIFTLTAVSLTNKTLAFTGTATGTTALQATTAANLTLYFNGAKTNQMTGISQIIANTGTLFNISATTYNLWQANSLSLSSGALTLQRIINATALPVGRGLEGEIDVYVCPQTWANLATDLAAQRMLDSSYSSAKIQNGTQSIEYFYQGGKMNVVSHLYLKAGDCFVLPTKQIKRIGSTDITSVLPGAKTPTQDMFVMSSTTMGYESRMFSDQAVLIQKPAWALKISGFVNVTTT